MVEGWTAWRYEHGERIPRSWVEIIAVGREFHAAMRGYDRPGFIDARQDRWSVGDRVAWGELSTGDYRESQHIPALAAALRPIAAPAQLIHGDLTGNVLFADGMAPLVIDLSPYWRPPTFAAAIVLADALVFEGADESLLDTTADLPDFAQHLLRALLYRLVTEHVARDEDRDRPDVSACYGPAVDLALRSARVRSPRS